MHRNRLIIAGGSGFLGRILEEHFANRAWEVWVFTRTPIREHDVRWDAQSISAWTEFVDGADAVINLTGRSVNCRYNTKNRAEIMDSRVHSTRVLGQAIARCKNPPRVWLNASTATIYKHTLGQAHDEFGEIAPTPEAKDEFSVHVAQAWEAEFKAAKTPNTRKVALRAAMVLGHGQNSVFPMLRRLTLLGLGGRMGSGQQFVSWIHHEDFCRAIEWIIDHEELRGPINLAAPNPLTNAEMMRTLRKLCDAKIGLPATPWMLELGAYLLRTETELIIKSRKVIPRRLSESGFQFNFPEIGAAFAELNERATARRATPEAPDGRCSHAPKSAPPTSNNFRS